MFGARSLLVSVCDPDGYKLKRVSDADMEPSGEVAAGSLISLRVEKESLDEGPVVASLISPRVEKDVTRAPEDITLGRYRTC